MLPLITHLYQPLESFTISAVVPDWISKIYPSCKLKEAYLPVPRESFIFLLFPLYFANKLKEQSLNVKVPDDFIRWSSLSLFSLNSWTPLIPWGVDKVELFSIVASNKSQLLSVKSSE